MATWLQSVQKELDGVSNVDSAEPDDESGAGETEVGIADNDLRKLFYLCKRYQQLTLETVAALTLASKKEREEKTKKAQHYKQEADALIEVFWISVRSAFDLWDKPQIGIRKGWKVIWKEGDKSGEGKHHGHHIIGLMVPGDIFGESKDEPSGDVSGKPSVH